jgi:hypothetical protein
MSKILRLTESELVRLVKRMIKESEEGFEVIDDFEDIPDESTDFPDDDGDEFNRYEDIMNYGLDYKKESNYDDKFQKNMNLNTYKRKNRQSSIGIGAGTRWDKDSEKEWSPIKADDLPLDKFLKSKYNKR